MKKEGPVTVHINGMSCGHCVAAVEKALKNIKGIKDARVEIGKAEFQAPDEVNEETVKNAVEEAGYEVSGIEK